MRFNLFRSQALSFAAVVLTIGALAFLAYLFVPLLSASGPEKATGPRVQSSTPPGSAGRIAQAEADLKALQAEAAKDPARPTVAEMEDRLQALQAEAAKDPARPTVAAMKRRLDRMVRERNVGAAPAASRLERLVEASLGLSLILGLALLALALGQLFGPRLGQPNRPVM
jgi:hypothetical protein